MIDNGNTIVQDLNQVQLSHNGDWVEITFEKALFSLFENNTATGKESSWELYEYCKTNFLGQGKGEKISYGFKILAQNILESEGDNDKEAQRFFSLPDALEGTVEIKSTGLNTTSKNHRIQIRFTEKNSRTAMPYQTAGLLLKSRRKLFSMDPQLEKAFRTYRNYESLAQHTEKDHLNLIATFKAIKNDRITVIENRFKNLDITEVQKVGLNLTRLDSGDLQLEPNLLGIKTKDENAIKRELNQLTKKQVTGTLRIGKELTQLEPKAIDGIQEIRNQSIIKKENVDTFLKNPGSFINADKVDLETGFSFRVKGISEFTRIQHVDIEPGNNDWFLSNTAILTENFEDHIHNEVELKNFIQKVEEAYETNAEKILFDGKQFKVPPKEEFKWRIEEKSKELANTSLDLVENTNQKKLKTQVSFDLKYYNENQKIVSLYETHELPQYTMEGLRMQPFEHQRKAIEWIFSLYRCSLKTNHMIKGGILADDMGLGKTFSSLLGMKAIIEFAKEQDIKKTTEKRLKKCFMVVAPLSLLNNWKNEVSKFFDTSPFTDVIILNAQEDLSKFRLKKGDERKQFLSDDRDKIEESNIQYCLKIGKSFHEDRLDIPGRLILITYETLRNYQFSMGRIPFSCIVFDEAQKIKNPNSLATRAAKALSSDVNIMATGTPVENDLQEYWCLMDAANERLFGAKKDFVNRYIQRLKNDDSEAAKLEVGKDLYKASGPFLLRRTKEELKDKLGKRLPKKIEYKGISLEGFQYLSTLDKPMTDEQVSAYEQIRKNFSKQNDLGSVLKNLYSIRKCMLHPRLTFENTTNQMTALNSQEFWKESAKLSSLLEIISKVKVKEEKLIIFAISRSIQYLIKKWIKIEFGLNPDIISGETKVASHNFEETRMGMIETFSNQSGFNVIILSPLAAGVGLNITAANHIFHLERHWNPAKEAQANDRAYRIGQKKDVSIYYPISKHPRLESFDIKLDKLLSRKTFTKDALVTYPKMSEKELAEKIQE
jgi:SNF2 family DNA or RNA helicase